MVKDKVTSSSIVELLLFYFGSISSIVSVGHSSRQVVMALYLFHYFVGDV